MIDTGDTAWVLISTALVMLMTPGLALFYGGLVRRKNVLSTIMHSFFMLALVSVHLGAVGLLAGLRARHRAGDHRHAAVGRPRRRDRAPSDVYATTVPHLAFMAFQMMFAIITPALITGAFAERKRFKAFVLFSIGWSTLVYAPIAHWVWSPDGWLYSLGVLDFAGGTVVHTVERRGRAGGRSVVGPRMGLVEPPPSRTTCR